MAHKPLTNEDVLKSHGLVEVTNADGSKSQITITEAEARIEQSDELKKKLSIAKTK